jgi:hypothetical protein
VIPTASRIRALVPWGDRRSVLRGAQQEEAPGTSILDGRERFPKIRSRHARDRAASLLLRVDLIASLETSEDRKRVVLDANRGYERLYSEVDALLRANYFCNARDH